jgi:hypothetical protein
MPRERAAISLTAASELADLASLFGDLLVANMAAHHINAPEIQGRGFLYLRRACWEGAIIAYGRCFGSGRGFGGRSCRRLDDFLVHLPEGLQASHDAILARRNQRIGHNVAPQSGQDVEIFAGIDRPEPGTVGLNNLFVHVETELYDTDLLKELQEITLILREKVGGRIDELRTNLFYEVAADSSGVIEALRSGVPWNG